MMMDFWMELTENGWIMHELDALMWIRGYEIPLIPWYQKI